MIHRDPLEKEAYKQSILDRARLRRELRQEQVRRSLKSICQTDHHSQETVKTQQTEAVLETDAQEPLEAPEEGIEEASSASEEEEEEEALTEAELFSALLEYSGQRKEHRPRRYVPFNPDNEGSSTHPKLMDEGSMMDGLDVRFSDRGGLHCKEVS